MASECHSVVRAPAMRVTREGPCGELLDSSCAMATSESFVDITLTKVYQERQDALQLNANGDICVDKPKAPILRWYEVVITFCNVDPELFNIVSAEPLVLNDAAVPVAVGWDTMPNSASASAFGLEFWVNTEDDCTSEDVVYGYGLLPRVTQGTIGTITVGNQVINFTVNAITRGANQWGQGPYNVLINESGANVGLPGPLLAPGIPAAAHKRFMWTKLPPPDGVCGCQDLTPVLAVAPLTGTAATPRVVTFPLAGGVPILPAVIDWGDLTADTTVTSGTTATHTYIAGTYTATFRSTTHSGPTYTSAVITVT